MLIVNIYDEYLLYLKKRYKKQTFNNWTYNFNANILSFFKNYNLNDIDVKTIIDWENFILEKNFKNNHNKNLFGMLKNFISYEQKC